MNQFTDRLTLDQTVTPHRRRGNPVARSAFTLIELLTVIAIIGIIAAVVAPTLNNFRKGDAMLSASRALLDGVARARQLAISQHTTVFMVFAPPEFWDNSLYPNATPYSQLSPYPAELAKLTNIVPEQLTGFTLVSLRSIGDQPGQYTKRQLSDWQSLPEKAFIAPWKFYLPSTSTLIINDAVTLVPYWVYGFNVTNIFPFPSEDTPYVAPTVKFWLPYIAFDYQGRLVTADGSLLGHDEFIPLDHGSIGLAADANKNPILAPPSIQEQPPGNSTNSAYNLIHIDALTGRARLERQQVK